MIYLIIGVIAIAAGIGLMFFAKRKKSHALEMKYLKTSKVSELNDLHSTLLNDLGPDSIKQMVEVKGNNVCNNPLTSEIAGETCVAFKYSVEERYEEDYEEKDSDGNYVRKTRTGYKTVESNERRTEFEVDDGTGKIKIDPDNANMDMEKSAENYEAWNRGMTQLSFGNFSFSVSLSSDRRRILGYRIREYIFPVNRRVYVVGEMQDGGNTPVIRKPMEADKPYIISTKSEEEVIKGTESSANILNVLGIILIAAGIAGIVYQFVGNV